MTAPGRLTVADRAGAWGLPSLFTIENFNDFPAALRGAFLAVGNFDGVHLGHARLVGRLRALADAAGAPAVALTFDPHPAALLRPDRAPVPLSWTSRNAELLQTAGATEVGVFRTGPWLLGLSAREFFDRLVALFGASGMVEGPNFAFGRDRGGDAAKLGRWCDEVGIGFEIVEPTLADGAIVSSTRIRGLLVEGRVAEAARLLGRPHRVRGVVEHGAARGRGLGFPTANLGAVENLVPGDGVHATLAYVDGKGRGVPAATHVGPNVTFGERERKVEAHLIDFEGDLYGRALELEFLDRVRPTRKFEGLDDLLAQLRADVGRVREACAGRFA